MLISICMCTYKRKTLKKTLDSLCAQVLPDGCTLEVVVVDNDVMESGREIVEKYLGADIDVNYYVNGDRNLSSVRNSSMEYAQGTYIAFIDDDEWAAPDWISALYSALQQYDADAVFGRVDVYYPEDTPQWIVKGDLFGKDGHKTGEVLTKGATSNALLKAEWVKNKGVRFDLHFGKSGGEDTDFFHRIYNAGGKLVFENTAVVSETVESHRLNLDYLLKQNKRIGQTHWDYLWSKQSGFAFVKTGLFVVAQVIGAAGLTLLSLPFGRGRYTKWYLLLIRNLVKLKTAAVGSDSIELYGNN